MTGGYGTEPAWKIGEEREIKDGKIRLCEWGYHSSPNFYDALNYAKGNMACIVEVSQRIEKDSTKQVSRKRRLIDARNAEKVLRAWACDCAERALKKAKVTDERSWKVIAIVRLYNEGKATRIELAAARDAAWAAAGAAAGDAARDAASAAAWDAARATAGDAARDAAYAAGAAAGAAASAAEIKWQKRRLNWYMNKLFKGE